MAPSTTITVVPTSQHQRAFRKWAGPRGVATLPGNGFAVPVQLIGEVPQDLLLGARVNGQVYLPAEGEVRYDAPPLDDPDDAFLDDLREAMRQPVDVVAGFPQVTPDDIPTTGAPSLDGEDSP